MADLKTTNIYGDAYINNKVGIATNAPATRLQIGQLSPTAATEGIQFGDDTSARLHRINTGHIRSTGGFSSATFIIADNYLQTNNNLIYPASQTATQRLEVGNASGNAWVDGLTIAQGGNVTVYNNLTVNNAATVTNDLTVNGNTYLGNAGGDTVFVNDIIRIGATDSGDASLFFGEGSVAGSDYGARWYWDSGYTFTWYTRNAGTDTQLFNYVTNDLSYVNWNRNFNMQNYSINYNAQIHFNAGTRFVGEGTNYLIFRSDATNAGGIRVQDGGITTKGYTGYWDTNGGGILNNSGEWAVRYNFGSANSGGTLYGAWTVNGNISAANLSGTNTGDQSIGNGTITIAAGTGIGVGTSNTFTTNQSGATTVTVTNSGVTSNVAGTGISVSGATGAVTVTNTGVTSVSAGTGIGTSASTGAVTITNSGVTSAVAGTGVGVSAGTGAVTFSIGQAVGTANSPTFVAVTTSTDGANHIMAGSANAEGIRMTPASSTTYPVFLRSINPGSGGEASPWIYKEQATEWGIWHNNPVNSIDFTKAGSGGIASNVGGGTNTVVVRVDMGTGYVQTIAGYRNSAGTTILDNSGNITGNASTATNVAWSGITSKPTTLSGFGITDAFPLSGGTITGNSTFSADNYLTFGPNSSWSRYLRIGGNGYTATAVTMASVVTTNGNLHLDAAKAAGMGIYLNWYGGAGGTLFGNGSGTQVGIVDGSGNAAFIGTLAITGAITGASFSGAGTGLTGTAASLSIGGNAGTATTLQTARTINGTSFNGSAAITTANWGTARTLTIGSTGKSVDGSTAITWSLAEIGAAATNQTMFVGTTSVAINRTSAAQTLTGISIDGNAATAGGLAVHGGTNNEANKIVRTDGNGYINAGWINTPSGDMPDTQSINRIYCSDDQYIRYKGVADFKQQIGLTYKNATPRSANTTDTNYWTGIMGWTGTDWNSMSDWGCGFVDSWDTPANRPPVGTHHVGIQALHYTNGTARYGWQMANGTGNNRWWLRDVWGGSFSTWFEILTSTNYTSFAPSLTGTGASGTWSINVTGTAGSISGFNNPTTAATANTIVYRDSSGHITGGYILGSYFNASAGNSENPTIGQIWTQNTTDNYLRKSTPAHFRSQVTDGSYPSLTGANASGTWSISVSGNAATATTAVSATSATSATYLNSSNYIQRIGSSGNYNTDFQNTPAGSVRHIGDDYAMTNNPGAGWWFVDSYRHSNGNGYWGTQVAWGWEDNANRLATRNVQNGSYGGWVYYLNSANYNSYSPTLTGTGASGTWSINVTGNAGGSSTSCSGNAATATALTSMNISQFTNNSGYLTSVTNISGNAATATLATKASTLSQGGGTGTGMTFNWSGQGGQPTWLWGSNDGTNIYVWNPSNFNVNYATSAGSATSAGTATTANALTTGNTYQVANIGIGVSPSNRLHINGDGVNPTIRIDNTVFGTGSSNSRVFFGWLPISINVYGTVTTKYIQLYNSF